MPGSKPWLKMWVEWIDDPKMDRLSLAGQGAWWRLVALAHKCAADGTLAINGSPLSLDEIMKTLKITSPADQKIFREMVGKMTAADSLSNNSQALTVKNYAKRQAMIPSGTKAALADRQRKSREKKKRSADEYRRFENV